MIDKHRMWSHVTRGGVYEVLGTGVYSGPNVADMGKVRVSRAGLGWDRLEVHGTAEAGDLAIVQVQEGTFLTDGAVVAVYRGADAKVWVRPAKDFYDGRFRKLDDNLQPISALDGPFIGAA